MRANDCLWWLAPDVAVSVVVSGVVEPGKITRSSGVWVAKCNNRETKFSIGGPAASGWTSCPFCGGYLIQCVPSRYPNA